MNKLEDFIKNNKEAFDDYQPSDVLWHRLEKNIQQPQKRAAPVFRLSNAIKWVAAAALLTLGIAAYFLTRPAAKPDNNLAQNNNKVYDTATGSDSVTQPYMPDTVTQLQNKLTAENKPEAAPDARDRKKPVVKKETQVVADSFENDALYQYARVVAQKQEAMKTLAWHAPRLYERFSGDLQVLEFKYQYLKNKLDTGYNSEQVLQAMLQNLKLQSELLNKQLKISKKVKNKKHSHEKIYSL